MTAPEPFDYRSERWINFRHEIFSQRGCRCEIDGYMHPGNQLHHRKSAYWFPDDAFDPKNVIVLCMDRCHKLIHHCNRNRGIVYAAERTRDTGEWIDVPQQWFEDYETLCSDPRLFDLAKVALLRPGDLPTQKPTKVEVAAMRWNVPRQFDLPVDYAANDNAFRIRRKR